MIDHVEELGAKLEVDTLHQVERLEQGSIHGEQARAFEDVPAGISVETRPRQTEGMRVEPSSLLPYDNGAGESRIERNAIRVPGVAAPGLVESHQQRKWKTTLRGDHPVHLPSAEHYIGNPACILQERLTTAPWALV